MNYYKRTLISFPPDLLEEFDELIKELNQQKKFKVSRSALIQMMVECMLSSKKKFDTDKILNENSFKKELKIVLSSISKSK